MHIPVFISKLAASRRQQIRSIKGNLVRASVALALTALTSAPMWAIGGTLKATQAVGALSTEVSGPLAYGFSLIMIVGSAVAWYRSHHDAGALTNGTMGTLFVTGVATGAASLLGFIPGVSGALI